MLQDCPFSLSIFLIFKQTSIHPGLFFSSRTHSVEDAHELHKGLSVTLFSSDGLNSRLYLREEPLQAGQDTRYLCIEQTNTLLYP